MLTLVVLGMVVGCKPSIPVTDVPTIGVDASGIEVVETTNMLDETDWPAWRGPQGNGVAIDQPAPTTWDQTTHVGWMVDVVGRGHSSPIIVGESIFLATAIEAEQKQLVLSFERSDGRMAWSTTIHEGDFPAPKEIHKKGTYANGTLASDGKLIYATFFNAGKIRLTALTPQGEIQWQQDLGPFQSKFGYAPSPVLYKSLVIVAADNWGGGYLVAVDATTGKLAWQVARGAISTYSSPFVGAIGGRDQLVITGISAITSYDPATGEELWRTEAIAEATCGTVVTDGERIFASGGYPQRETICVNSQGERMWEHDSKIYEPSMVVSGDLLIGITDDGIAHGWDSNTGDLHWRQRLGGNFSASPVLCNGLIYASNLSGETFVFPADPSGYKQLAKNRLGDDCYASPAFSRGEIFLRVGVGQGDGRREKLVCIRDQTKSQE